MGKKVTEEYTRFMDLLRRLVAVPKKEVDEKIAALREQREKGEPEPET